MRRFAASLLFAALAGCSGFTPFVTGLPPLAPGEADPGSRVSICYNTLKTSPETLQHLAQAECPAKTVAELSGTDYRLDNCPLMTPGRANFLCKSAK